MMCDVAEMLEVVNVRSHRVGYDAFCGEFRADSDANELVMAE
jgi:hypothetical protein